jgi:hypothetical protein
MDMKDRINQITDICNEMKDADPERKKELTDEFWTAAIEAFNENVAGTIVTASGKVLHTPPIEL